MTTFGDRISLITGNPMTKVLLALLAFEAIVAGLSIAVMIQVSGVAPLPAALAGAIVALLAMAAAAKLRKGTLGFALGWITQIALVATGFLTPAMWVMAVAFVGLWLTCFILGKRLEADALSRSGESPGTDR